MTDIERVCALLNSDLDGATKGLDELKSLSKPDKAAVATQMRPLLDAFGKKTVAGVKSIHKAIAADKLTEAQRGALWGVAPFNERITEIEIMRVPMRELHPNIGKLTNLESLGLYSTKIETLPDELGLLAKLKKLDIAHGVLRKLPDTIGNLSALERFFVPNNRLEGVPASICKLSKLKELALSRNNLGEVPEDIGALTELEELMLDYTRITRLPDSLGKCVKLRHMILTSNTLKPSGWWGKLRALQKLSIDVFQPAMGELSALEELSLVDEIKKVPAGLEKIKSLRRLEMRPDGGKLDGLLELVKALPNLEYLRCWPGIPNKDAIAAACPKLELDE